MSSCLRYRTVLALVALLPLGGLSGCLFRSHKVAPRLGAKALKTASQAELIELINTQAARIKSLNATVDIAASVGGVKRGKVTEYQEIRGYVLVRKPAMLRMIGLFPVVRNRAFDMVSDGQVFRLSIPTRNKFFVGRNEVIHPSPRPLENLRPQHIFDALLLREIDPQNEIAVLEDGTEMVRDPKTRKEVEQDDYVILVVRQGQTGWFLARKIFFSRADLLPHRQVAYDKNGNVATDARYENFADHDGVSFPSLIHIERPQEEYSIGLSIVKLRLNETLNDGQFELPQPAGSQLVRLDIPSPSAACCPAGSTKPE